MSIHFLIINHTANYNKMKNKNFHIKYILEKIIQTEPVILHLYILYIYEEIYLYFVL